MPYIAIKSHPKDEKMKQALVEKINDAVLEVFGCRREAVSISFEEIAPAEWQEKVFKPEIEAHKDKMMIFAGKKQY